MHKLALALILTLVSASVGLAEEGAGRIVGRVTDAEDIGLGGIHVTIDETGAVTRTNTRGEFAFEGLVDGTYSLTFAFLDNTVTRADVVVEAGSITRVDQQVDWKILPDETVIVTAPSRKEERIVEAPAAVSIIAEDEIARDATHNQVPKLLEFTPGMTINQNDLYEFVPNARGFANALSRRVAVLVDGRDTTDPFVGAPEWATIAGPLDDLYQVEMLRGPTSALYGANATTGLMSLVTRAPRYSQGGQLRLTFGELDTRQADFRWAGALGGDWYMRAVASGYRSDYFAKSRLDGVEYSKPCTTPGEIECLPLDSIPLVEDGIEIVTGGLRFDKYLSESSVLTFEGGGADYSGTVFVNAGGPRGQIIDVKRPWARFNYNTKHWNVLGYYNGRESESRNITTGAPFELEADNFKIEAQTNWDFASDRIRLIAGASYLEEGVETAALREPVDIDEQALFAQVDWNASRDVKLVVAARWDDSTLHDPQVSPKAAVVWNVVPEHTLRFTYNEAFQVPTYVEYLLYIALGSVSLTDLETGICEPANVSCGLGDTPLVILGNEGLPLEETTSFEIGYNGVLWNKALLTIELYRAKNENFTTTFLPQRGTPIGQVNKNLGPWQGPPDSESTAIDPADCPVAVPSGSSVADCVRATADADYPTWQLTTPYGENIFAFLSVTTFGEVDTEGVDIGLVYYPARRWKLSAGYSWFDFEIVGSSPGLDTILFPNMPENKAFVSLLYDARRWDAGLSWRWSDEFIWANGLTFGTVESYAKTDLVANYGIGKHWRVGLNVANLFDSRHWETFGGSLLRRRALVYGTFFW
jgi:iron complex outermembrane receptor protein